MELGRLRRAPVKSALMLLGGSGMVYGALGQAGQPGDSPAYVGALLIGLMGIVGSLVTLVTKLIEKREHLVRGDLAERMASMEQRIAALEEQK